MKASEIQPGQFFRHGCFIYKRTRAKTIDTRYIIVDLCGSTIGPDNEDVNVDIARVAEVFNANIDVTPGKIVWKE